MITRSLLMVFGSTVPLAAATAQLDSISLSGSDADGYFAVVGLNQEAGVSLAGISRVETSPKFFDYPAYVNPQIPNNIYIMYVTPYRFGLSYPDPLHPVSLGVFESVGPLRPASEAGQDGVTFIEAVSEDDGLIASEGSIFDGERRRDFSASTPGTIEFDTSLVTGVGTEVVVPDDITLTLDGSEFRAINRTQLSPADAPPFGIDGRSNRNEAASTVDVTARTLAGNGLTFQGGLLTSIDLEAEVDVRGAGFALGANALIDVDLFFEGNRFRYDGDEQVSSFFASNVRLILNRTGPIDSVGSYVVPGACAADFNGDQLANGADVQQVVDAITISGADYTGDGEADFTDVLAFLVIAEAGCTQ